MCRPRTNPNEKVDIVIRPEDLELTTVDKGKLNVTVDTQLFRGVHYELSTYDAGWQRMARPFDEKSGSGRFGRARLRSGRHSCHALERNRRGIRCQT